MRTSLLFFIALCLLPARVISGPDETTQHLMSDSASILDFGMLRLNLSLEALALAKAYYDWDENRIYIWRVFPSTETADAADAAEKTCSQWVGEVRSSARINRDTGKPFSGSSEFSTFAGYFSHYGFKRNLAPETLGQDIDKLFVLNCSAFFRIGKFITISAPLLGTGYSLDK